MQPESKVMRALAISMKDVSTRSPVACISIMGEATMLELIQYLNQEVCNHIENRANVKRRCAS